MSVTRIDPGKTREFRESNNGRAPRCPQVILPGDGFQIPGRITRRWFPPEWPPTSKAA